MTDQHFQHTVESISKVIDAVGVGVIVLGLVVAVVSFIGLLRAPSSRPGAYRSFRQQVGKAILLGLEFLVAADIIRTVAVDPTFKSVGVLAIIVAVRTFLSFTLDVELDGRWPWQTRPDAAQTERR